MAGGGTFSLSPDCSLKLLEEPAVYDRARDELYFINQEALDCLAAFTAGAPLESAADGVFIRFCVDEGILVPGAPAAGRDFDLHQGSVPSLRYLLLHMTERCNLRCRHCFAGEAGDVSMSVEDVLSAAEEFEAMQGLRLMLSGGEPLLHPQFWEINDRLAELDLRVILMTNGTLVDEAAAGRIRAQEVQVSLDGLGGSHDLLRGAGSFDRSLRAVQLLREQGVDVSIATMIHEGNLEDFTALAGLVRQLDVREWSVDLPSPAGRMHENRELLVEPAVAAPLLDLSFGGAVHEPFPGFACGSHLMAVTADGGVARCGFYADRPVGNIWQGLSAGWQNIERIPLAELDCDCEYLAECRGGCRFRAGGYNNARGADLCQCYRYGVMEGQQVN